MNGKAAGHVLALALALALALGGCVTPGADLDAASTSSPGPREPLTEPTFALGAFVSTEVRAHDGIALHVDLQLPEGEGPFPAILEFTPYSSTLNPDTEAWGAQRSLGQEASHGLVDAWVPRGYAVAVAHVRGSGQSGGCFDVGSENDGLDGHALVEWLAAQEWSNGKVAMTGTSYVGTTPIATAVTNPPHLTTIVPVSAVSEWYRYYFENGEPRFFGELPFGVVYTDQPIWAATGIVPKPRNPAAMDPASNAQCGAAQMENAYAQDDYNAYWMSRNYVKDLHNATAPMLYAHGFLDENTPTSLVTDFYDAYPGEKRLWMQQHGHGVPDDFEAYHEAVHRWMDFWLLGKDNGALDMPAVILQDDREMYHVEADWPPKNATWTMLHLADGALAAAVPADGTVSYTDLVPCRDVVPGIPFATHFETCDPEDPRREAGGILSFVTEPLEADLHVSGAPRLELVASSDKPDTQFDITLLEIAADGTVSFVTRGHLDARHGADLARGADLTPGEEQLFVITMHGRDHHVEAGNRLALSITSHDEYVLPDQPGATNTIRLGADGSRLLLPTLEGAVFLDEAPAYAE